MTEIIEYSEAVSLVAKPEYGIEVGDVGTVVMVHNEGEGYEVEFPNGEVVTLRSIDLRALDPKEMTHVRTILPKKMA